MSLDRERIMFGSKLVEIGEDEFGASFSDEPAKALEEALYSEFVKAGKPKDGKKWLRARLAELFACLNDRPRWVEDSCSWPYFGGKPMVFIGQMTVREGPIASEKLSPEVELYIFGARKQLSSGWGMHYEVVEQEYALASGD